MLFQEQRPRFFEGQYLGAADLTAAVAYGRLQHARHALGAHTWGIAMGLQLQETPLPDGTVEVHILPGYAWDGFGRPVVVLAPYQIPEALFSAITFQPGVDDTETGRKGRLFPVWLRYDETATQNVRPGFEVCDTDDQHSRVQETFRVEVGTKPTHADRHDPVRLAGQAVDAEQALKQFDPAAPVVYDESVPHQMLPEEGERVRWLIPLGYVRWLPVPNQPGHFVPRDDADRPPGSPDPVKDSDKIRAFRRYIGVVAEALEAADGAIRLRDRYKAPANAYRTPLTTTDPNNPPVNDLVWVEGHVRVLGDARLAGGRLDFRDAMGEDGGVPLWLQRTGDNPPGDRALQVLLGPDSQANNRFAVGPLRASDNSVDEKFVVLSGGNVGIGTSAPQNSLHVARSSHLNAIFDRTDTSDHLTVVVGSDGSGLRFSNGNAFFIASQPYNDRNDTGFGTEHLRITSAGSVGLGTTTPVGRMTINGLVQPQQGTLTIFSQDADIAYDGGNDGLFIFRDTGGKTAFMGGDIGIGTTSPLNALHVARPSHLNVIFDRTDTTDHLTLVVGSVGSGLRFSNTNDFFIASEPYADRNSLGFGTAEHFRITSAGNIGIGTPTPAQKLDVRGHIKLHTDGSLFAPGGVENLRILRGTVQSNGAVAAGTGFSVIRVPFTSGLYEITFDQPFADRPSAAVTQVYPDLDDFGNGGDTRDNAVIVGINANHVRVKMGDANGNAAGRDFTFIVVGPR
jgi:hypothetical protein